MEGIIILQTKSLILQKVKEELLASDNQLRLANNKLEDLTIKKLTKNNETMQKLFKESGTEIK